MRACGRSFVLVLIRSFSYGFPDGLSQEEGIEQGSMCVGSLFLVVFRSLDRVSIGSVGTGVRCRNVLFCMCV